MYRYCNKGRHLEIKLVGKEKERAFLHTKVQPSEMSSEVIYAGL